MKVVGYSNKGFIEILVFFWPLWSHIMLISLINFFAGGNDRYSSASN